VLSGATTQYLSAISNSGELTFTQSIAELNAIAPGEVIASEPNVVAPDGFLRMVTDVTSSGGNVIVTTLTW
jgi:hypothetical protein